MASRPPALYPVVRRLSDGKVMTLAELAIDTAPSDPNAVVCTRCGASTPKRPGSAWWMTFRFGCPACADRADLPDRPGAA